MKFKHRGRKENKHTRQQKRSKNVHSERKGGEKKNDAATKGNRKAMFNRYRDKQRVEEAIEKKKLIEAKFQHQDDSSSSEEEPINPVDQLLSTFSANSKKSVRLKAVVSDDSDYSDSSNDEIDVKLNSEAKLIQNDHENPMTDNQVDGESIKAKKRKLNESETSFIPKDDVLAKEENIRKKELDRETEIEDSTNICNDPFTTHLRNELHDSLLESVSSTPTNVTTKVLDWPVLGKVTFLIPTSEQTIEKSATNKKLTVLEDKIYTSPGVIPSLITSVDYSKLYIKSQIQENVPLANKQNLIKNDLELSDTFTPLQKEVLSVINNYQDLFYSDRSFINGEEIRFIYCLHAVNHILKTRTKILHHNAKLAKKCEVPDEFRDQGLVRPKVLILVPFKDAAYRVVNTIINLIAPKEAGQVMNKKRFVDDFTGSGIIMPKRNPKPEDYELLFNGNTEDTFRMGLSITKKTLKLYTDFYSSDIIIASPLGLRVIIGAEGEEDRDYDFLSSIELLILDQADVFLMQNWEHLLHVLDHLHLQPKKAHGTDFSRLRLWAVNGWTKYYRQTIVFSSALLPEINSLFNKKCHNYSGKAKVSNPVNGGSIRHVTVQIPQVFRRISSSDPLAAIDARFNYFVKEILPQYRDSIMSHTLIYVPSYFDYVRVRNHFKKEDVSFVQICEYSKDEKVSRARDIFFHTEANFLLYSERFHFFRRMRIKGIRHIIFYQPPTYSHFYSEMCNLMQETYQNQYGGSECNMTVTVLYTKYDLQQLAAIVGSERTLQMAQSERNVHMFTTGE